MSFTTLRNIWQRLRSPRGFVGADLEGNTYFEYPNPHGAHGRTKRVVKYRRGFDMWTYVAGDRRLAVQWTSWLTHTRAHPPSIEELQADLARQERVLYNAALIEARDKEASLHIEEPQVKGMIPAQSVQTPSQQRIETEHDVRAVNSASKTYTRHRDSHVGSDAPAAQQNHAASPIQDEPQSWSPRTIRRSAN